MTAPSPVFDPRRFRSTVAFYDRYRLGYPDRLIARVAQMVDLKSGDAVMDLGCGPGTLAIPFARLGMNVVAVDPEPDMLAAAKDAAQKANVEISVHHGSSFELPAGIGPFRLVTMGRSFHWMDRTATLKMLHGLIEQGGAIALFHDDRPKTEENAWHEALRKLADRYGRAESPHVQEWTSPRYRRHESYLLESAFSLLDGLSVFVKRDRTVDDIIGLAFSLSTSSPEKLGDRASVFEAELRAALTELSPSGHFTEIAEVIALVARRA